jgi:outer membrane protein assembly factor BamB
MKSEFAIVNGNLQIRDSVSNKILWEGKPKGIRVNKILPDPTLNKCFVLLSSEDWRDRKKVTEVSFRNILCIGQNGNIIWVSELPVSSEDDYGLLLWSKDYQTIISKSNVVFREGTIIGVSFSGYLVELDPENGRILQKLIIK